MVMGRSWCARLRFLPSPCWTQWTLQIHGGTSTRPKTADGLARTVEALQRGLRQYLSGRLAHK